MCVCVLCGFVCLCLRLRLCLCLCLSVTVCLSVCLCVCVASSFDVFRSCILFCATCAGILCVCLCVCVRERERVLHTRFHAFILGLGYGLTPTATLPISLTTFFCAPPAQAPSVFVCVFVCVFVRVSHTHTVLHPLCVFTHTCTTHTHTHVSPCLYIYVGERLSGEAKAVQ